MVGRRVAKPQVTDTRVAATSPRTIGQKQQIAAADAVVSNPQAVAEAPSFPRARGGESEGIVLVRTNRILSKRNVRPILRGGEPGRVRRPSG